MSDVSLDSASHPKSVIIRIKASKTDQFRQGVDIHLNELCPVSALLAYISIRGLEPGPLFRFENGSPPTREALVREVRAALLRPQL